MMISPPSAGDPFQAAAAVGRSVQSPGADGDPSQSDSTTLESGPDVVVTLSKPSDAPPTYNASGKLSGAPAMNGMGANAPDSLAKASESGGDDDTAPDSATPSSSSGSVDANVHVDTEATAEA